MWCVRSSLRFGPHGDDSEQVDVARGGYAMVSTQLNPLAPPHTHTESIAQCISSVSLSLSVCVCVCVCAGTARPSCSWDRPTSSTPMPWTSGQPANDTTLRERERGGGRGAVHFWCVYVCASCAVARSTGCIFIELTSGMPAFNGDTEVRCTTKHHHTHSSACVCAHLPVCLCCHMSVSLRR